MQYLIDLLWRSIKNGQSCYDPPEPRRHTRQALLSTCNLCLWKNQNPSPQQSKHQRRRIHHIGFESTQPIKKHYKASRAHSIYKSNANIYYSIEEDRIIAHCLKIITNANAFNGNSDNLNRYTTR